MMTTRTRTRTIRTRIRIDDKKPPRRLLLLSSAEMIALPILLWFVCAASSVTKTVVVDALDSSFDNSATTDNHRMLRRHLNDNDVLTSPTGKQRLLQAFTNETTDYEDGPAVNQDREVDFDYCFGALQRADSNDDGRIETSDYLRFVQDFGQNTECLGDLLSLKVRPIELTACWNQLTCQCRSRGGAPDCCSEENAHLSLSGINAVDSAQSIEQEQNFLNQVCLRSDQCVISYCGYPPPPLPPVIPVIPIPPPPVVVPKETPDPEPNYLWLLLLLLLLCCCHRRWFLVPAGKADEDSDDEEDPEQAPPGPGDPTVMRSLPVDNDDEIALPTVVEDGVDDFEGDYNDPDANRMAMKSMAASELGEGGGVRYYRVVKEPEYEEPPPPPEPKVIDQYDKGLPPGDSMKLNHVEKPPPPPEEEDPYALEHFVPDGGVVEYERSGEWNYEADGGYTPEERAAKEGSEWNRPGFERAAVAAVVATDDRRDRNLDQYGGGAVFDHLDETDEPVKKSAGGNPLEWVFSKTLNTLDDNEDDLRSEPSTSKRSLM